MTEHYLEDYFVGQKFISGRLRVEKERITSFAAESIRNRSTSMKTPHVIRSSRV